MAEEIEILNPRELESDKGKLASRVSLSSSILYFTIFNLLGIGIGIIIIFILSFTDITIDLESAQTNPSDSAIYLNLIVNALAITSIGIVSFLFNQKLPITKAQNQFSIRKYDLKIIGIAIIVIVAIVGSFELFTNFILNKFFSDLTIETPYDFFNSNNLGILFLALIIVTILAPLAEEIFYRWNLIKTLKYGYDNSTTILLSALIFAFAHSAVDLNYSFTYFIIHFIATFIIGLTLGFVYLKTKRILSTILIHGFWNLFLASSAFFAYVEKSNVFDLIYLVTVCVCGALFIGIIIFYISKGYTKHFRNFMKLKTDEKIIENESNKGLIKLQWSWFELVLSYFVLICIIPLIINLLSSYFAFGETISPIVYFLVLTVFGMILLSRVSMKIQENYQIQPQKKLEVENEEIKKLESPFGDN